MANKKTNKAEVMIKKSAVFIANKMGASQESLAVAEGVSQRAISNWVSEIDDFMINTPQFQTIPDRLAGMIPSSLDTLEHRLKKHDLNAARDVWKMIGILYDRSKNEHTFNLGARSGEDLNKELEKLVGKGLRPVEVKEGTSETG